MLLQRSVILKVWHPMEWTVERDIKLTELHAKRVSGAFIASWMRWPPAAVRARLVELGLTKPLTPRAIAVNRAGVTPRVAAPPKEDEGSDDAFEDEEMQMKTERGCPRGHLLSEAEIAALYRGAAGNYRR